MAEFSRMKSRSDLHAKSPRGLAVVLVDVATPGYPKAQNSHLRETFTAGVESASETGTGLVSELAEHIRFLRTLRKESQMAKQPAPAAESGTPILSPGAVILRTYAPQPFPGPLANALARGRPTSERVLEDSRKGWRDFAQGPYRECLVPGQHSSIFDAPNVPLLADFIHSVLRDLVESTRPAVP